MTWKQAIILMAFFLVDFALAGIIGYDKGFDAGVKNTRTLGSTSGMISMHYGTGTPPVKSSLPTNAPVTIDVPIDEAPIGGICTGGVGQPCKPILHMNSLPNGDPEMSTFATIIPSQYADLLAHIAKCGKP